MHRVAAWDAWGCSLGSTGLQPPARLVLLEQVDQREVVGARARLLLLLCGEQPRRFFLQVRVQLTDHRRAATLTKGALAVVLIGIASVAFVALFPGFVVTFIGGAAYEDLVSEIWIFAAIGATFALAQFLLYSQIAASKRAAIVVLWIATAALVVLVIAFHASVLQIALIVLSVALSLSLVGVVELFFEKSREGRVAKHAS